MKMLSEKVLPVVLSLMLNSPSIEFGASGIGLGCGCLGDRGVGFPVCAGVGIACVGCC